jgi:hypothetical protein
LSARLGEVRLVSDKFHQHLDVCAKCASEPLNPCAEGTKLIEETAKALPDTGRQSTEPALQNIPIRTELGWSIREAFKAPGDRVTISPNYAQIEMRVMASMEHYVIEHFEHSNNPQKDCPLCSGDAGLPRKVPR